MTADLQGIILGEFGRVVTMTFKNENGVAQDISAFDGDKNLTFRAPGNRKLITSTFAFNTTGTDGIVTFTFTSDSTPDMAGDWKGQADLINVAATIFARSFPFTVQVLESLGQA